MSGLWCRNCNIETNADVCPVCGAATAEDLPVEVHWCPHCRVPIIYLVSQPDKGTCPVCGGKTKYISADLRPVFPEERLLVEILLGKAPNTWINCSIWASNNRYYIDGKPILMPNSIYQNSDTNVIAARIEEHKAGNSYRAFDRHIALFVKANKRRLDFLKDEAGQFIIRAAKGFAPEQIVTSFSGGKDNEKRYKMKSHLQKD